ncbi:MAG: polysaccharide deacetylase family protein [Roseiflexaceae bacterium]|nr:polysaccharide deacetylase family protein [Roseiflexaceae bacterium]
MHSVAGRSAIEATPVVVFHIAIGPFDDNGHCPVQASVNGRAVVSGLHLAEPLLNLGCQALHAGMQRIEDVPTVGRALGRALFTLPVRTLLLDAARSAAAEGARLQMRLQINAPELAALPWEYVSLGSTNVWTPALRADYTLVRAGRRIQPPPPLPLREPLRVLAVASPGNGHCLDALERALAPGIRAGRIDLRTALDANPATLRRALADEAPHVLHIAARVILTPERRLELDLGAMLDAGDLIDLLADVAELRLVTLTGSEGDGRLLDIASVLCAALLIDERLPATIAFSAPLLADEAARFAALCYDQLALGAPVDLAVTAGRAALARIGDVWGAPVLRAAPDTGVLFRPLPRRAARPRSMTQPLPFVAAVALGAALILGEYLFRAPGRSLSDKSYALRGAAPTARIEEAPTAGRLAFLPVSLPFSEPTATPTPLPPPSPTPLPAPIGYTVHLVAAGETLDGVAARLGSDVAAIAALNAIDPAAPLRPERALAIPLFRNGEPAFGLTEPVRRGNPASGRVALTFDIEIDDATLYAILEALRQRNVRGTFFVTGNWVKRFPDAARAIVAEGHEIANHSLTHPSFSRIGLDGIANELRETERIVQEITGQSTRPRFRFPYGDYTAQAIAAVTAEGFIPYYWSADDRAIPAWLDRAARDPAWAAGGILLMHGRPATAGMLPGVIDRLRAVGLEPTTLSETLR